MKLTKILLWALKLPPLAGYRSYIGLGTLAATGAVVGLQAAVGWLSGPEGADLVARAPVLSQILAIKAPLVTAGTWLALVGAAFNNESPRSK